MPSSGGVVLYGFRLAAARIAGDGKHEALALSVGEQEGHALVRLCRGDVPALALMPDL